MLLNRGGVLSGGVKSCHMGLESRGWYVKEEKVNSYQGRKHTLIMAMDLEGKGCYITEAGIQEEGQQLPTGEPHFIVPMGLERRG